MSSITLSVEKEVTEEKDEINKPEGRPSESGTAAGVLISLASSATSGVTEPPSPPPQLPELSLPPVLRNVVNNEPIVQPDEHTTSCEVPGVSTRVTKDFFKRPHPHALSKELVFEILTSGKIIFYVLIL